MGYRTKGLRASLVQQEMSLEFLKYVTNEELDKLAFWAKQNATSVQAGAVLRKHPEKKLFKWDENDYEKNLLTERHSRENWFRCHQ